MSDAQRKTIELYRSLMQINASAHLLRIARQCGVLEELMSGQKTLEDICTNRFLHREATAQLLAALRVIGIVEKYGEDFAISQAARLMQNYDGDLGDEVWNTLPDFLRGDRKREDTDDRVRQGYQSATQWIYTAAAMQTAEMLDIGGEGEKRGSRILDLGCGSAVWSCAIAHRDPSSEVVAVDHPEIVPAARATADSIGLDTRVQTIEADPLQFEIEPETFDVLLIAQRMHHLSDEAAEAWLSRCLPGLVLGGRVVIIDLFEMPGQTSLHESIEALRLTLQTRDGHLRTLQSSQSMMQNVGLDDVQFAFLAATKAPIGVLTGRRSR